MVINQNSLKHHKYHLKPGRLRYVFRYGICCVLLLISLFYFNLFAFILSCLFLIIGLYSFQPSKTPKMLQQLDQQYWSIRYVDHSTIDTLQIKTIIHHYIYIIIYFESSPLKSIVIFRDELSERSLKSLITMDKLNIV